jgi:hypothetical protein
MTPCLTPEPTRARVRLHPGFTGPSPCLHPPVVYWVSQKPLSSEEVEA